MKSIEMTASSYDEATELALAELGLTKEQVDVENLKESGIIRKKFTVKVTEKITTSFIAKNFVDGIIAKMSLDCTASVVEDSDSITVNLTGNDTSTLIGYRGDVLDSLQYLTLLVSNKANPSGKRIVLDGESYREKRTITLSKLAKKLAFSAAKNCEVISLEPMNPFERRIIHSALHDDKFVTTASAGEEPNRYVVITPNRRERKPYDPTNRLPRDGSRPNYNKDSSKEGGQSNYNSRPRYDKDSSKEGGQSSYNSRPSYEPKPTAPVQSESPKVPVEQGENKDMYDQSVSRNFRKNGASKMRSFGAPKTKYF